MEARKNPISRAEPSIPEAADRANSLIRDLQSRLRKGEEAAGEKPDEALDELDRQLQEAFSRQASQSLKGAAVPAEIRSRVVDGVVDRILSDWGRGSGGEGRRLEEEVIERLVERVLEQLRAPGAAPQARKRE